MKEENMSNLLEPAMAICLPDTLPPEQQFFFGISKLPDKGFHLLRSQVITALKNILRYIPQNIDDEFIAQFEQLILTCDLIPEFLEGQRPMAGFYCA